MAAAALGILHTLFQTGVMGLSNGAPKGAPYETERRRASSNPKPPRITNKPVPVIASGTCPLPPK